MEARDAVEIKAIAWRLTPLEQRTWLGGTVGDRRPPKTTPPRTTEYLARLDCAPNADPRSRRTEPLFERLSIPGPMPV
jgi:hypothetical protein